MDKEIVIINRKANNSGRALSFFSKKDLVVLTPENESKLMKNVEEKIEEGCNSFIICGGDGTVNNFLNIYMNLNEKIRKKLKIGIMPCGRANDLARKLEIPFSLDKAYEIAKKKRTKLIDIIQVNSKYFITGGGFGLPAEVIQDVNNTPKNIPNKILADTIYYIAVLKKVFKYSGIRVNGINTNLMFFAISNQDFIGKRFFITPNSINNDGFFEICYIPKPKNAISSFLIVQKVIKGEHIKSKDCVIEKTKSLKIRLDQKSWFMADGELLEFNNIFEFKTIPNSISLYY